MKSTHVFVTALLAALAGLGGCGPAGYIGYLLVPEKKVIVPAEFAELPGHRVGVVIYAPLDVLYASQDGQTQVRQELSYAIGTALLKNVPEVEVIAPERVIRFQEANIHWDSMPMAQVAQTLGADYVLYVSLSDYSVTEPGTADYVRARIEGSVSLWDASAEIGAASVWRNEHVAMTFPPDRPLERGGANERMVRLAGAKLFGERIARFFYEHEAPDRADRSPEAQEDLTLWSDDR